MRMKRLLVWGLSGAAILLAPWPAAAAGGDVAKGKAIYEQHCVMCHGTTGKGDGPAGKMLKPPAADLTSAASQEKSSDALAQVIAKGREGTAMPAWSGKLSPEQIDNLLAYLRRLAP